MKLSKMEQSRMFITSIIILLERYVKQPISIINLIDKTGYSRWYLQRRFCSLAGMSMKSYIRSRKMTEAAKVLLSTDRKVLDIAVEYGYPEQQSFCRVFKNHYGVSPTTFRKANTPRDELWMSAEKLLVKFKSSDKSIS
ncbi:helix-turn-helix transcriptional regulator [Klebsiella pneumoniae]|uniref:helix-turn-helix transcriptional regulator n=1 Tax=Klebsiella pneumoniae TaxID=573 RepID=UPI002247FF6F|nr:helix-turn-helix transcriptional regulator [Klebsiella pneumoniae]MCW9353325.1 helix-turn-helix transcriptional regulator [Klebsiella pneumoniae]